jgi:hypothetical protein
MKRRAGLIMAMRFGACALCILACRFRALADFPEETRARVIDQLRDFKEIPADSWSRARFRAKIGMAQVELRDFKGARNTLKTVLDTFSRDQYYLIYDFIKRLAVGEAAVGELDAAEQTLIAFHRDSSSRYYCDDLLSAALAAAKAGKKTDTIAAIAKVAQLVNRMKDGRDKQVLLFQLATTQIAIGSPMDAAKTRNLVEDLTGKLGESDPYRTNSLHNLGTLSAQLSDQAATKRYFADSLQSAKGNSSDLSSAKQAVAVGLAEAGDVAGAIQMALTIPESGDRDGALGRIALIQLKNGDRTGAEETAQKIQHYRQYQNESVLAIAETCAQLGDTKKAFTVAGNIKNNSRRAQAMLTIAAIVAEGGDKQAALKIAESLTYPTSQFLGGVFVFRDPKTWGDVYESGFAFTFLSWEVAKDTAGDLTAVAMRCRIAIRGKGDISYSHVLEGWDARKAAKAQTFGGDAAGALSWVERLPAEKRLEGLWGIAEGIGALLEAKGSR